MMRFDGRKSIEEEITGKGMSIGGYFVPPVPLTLYRPFVLLASLVGVGFALLITVRFVAGIVLFNPLVAEAQPLLLLLQSNLVLALGVLGLLVSFAVGGTLISARRLYPVYHELSVEHARSAAILSSIADGVVLRDPDGRVILANKAARDLLQGGDRFDLGVLAQADLLENDASGRWIEVGDHSLSLSRAPVYVEGQGHIGEVLVLRDVTQYALVERTRSSFLNQVGHELRTPLTAIRGYAELLRIGADRLSPQEQQQALRLVLEQSEILSGMIDRILEMAALDAQRGEIRRLPLDLNELAREALDECARRLDGAGVTSLFESEGPLWVLGDRRRLRSALDALLLNAQQFSHPGGRVWLRLRSADGMALVEVEDDGVGISTEDLPHIFERFYRGKPRDAAGAALDVRGLGQGLSVVKAIVEAHKGVISVQSEAGRGSCFSIRLQTCDSPRCAGEGLPPGDQRGSP